MTGWQTLFDQHLSALQPVSLVHSMLIPRPTFILCPPPMCLYVYVHVCVYLLEYGAMLQEHTVRCPTHKSTFIHRTWSWLLSCNTSSSLVCLTHCNMLLPTACCSAIHCYQQLCLLNSIQQHLFTAHCLLVTGEIGGTGVAPHLQRTDALSCTLAIAHASYCGWSPGQRALPWTQWSIRCGFNFQLRRVGFIFLMTFFGQHLRRLMKCQRSWCTLTSHVHLTLREGGMTCGVEICK